MNAGNFIRSDEKSDCIGVVAAVLSRSSRRTGSYASEDTRPYTFLPTDGVRSHRTLSTALGKAPLLDLSFRSSCSFR